MDWIVSVNGKTAADQETPLPVLPGRANSLTVRAAQDPAEEDLRAVLEVITADGRRRVERATMGPQGASLDLGPFTAPALYDYESGVVHRRGYRLRLRVEHAAGGKKAAGWSFYQGLTRDAEAEWLFPGETERVVYNDGHIPEDQSVWNPLLYSGAPMDPPILLRLAPEVLLDPDRVVAMYRLRGTPPVPGPIRATLVAGGEGAHEPRYAAEVEVDGEWQRTELPARGWPEGAYAVELRPEVGGKAYCEGPVLTYRRKPVRPGAVSVSPLSPFTLQLDPERDVVAVDEPPPEGVIEAEVQGWHAVFALADGPCGVRVGGEPWTRRVEPPTVPELGAVFVAACDLTGRRITIVHDSVSEKGIRSVRLVPVTEASVKAFRRLAENPPSVLCGVDDWWSYFLSHLREPAALDHGEFDRIMQGQREVGITSLAWAVGRSWVQYHSKLPDACLFPCADLSPEHIERYPYHEIWAHVVRDLDGWGYPLARRHKHGMKLHGWLCMNRHYDAVSFDGVFQSPWMRSHPEFNHQSKGDGSRDVSRVEYFFQEARRERLDILEEAAGFGPDGLVIGCCRQPPMAGYNEEMVRAYVDETGDDPRELDITDGERFSKWLRWRAEWFTVMLRDLRRRLGPVEERLQKRIPVAVRVPDEGIEWLLACGMDLQTWAREGLIDEVLLDPLDDGGSQVSHDLAPYVRLCREYGLTVLGGINGNTGPFGIHGQFNPVVGLRRALGVLGSGVDGIEIYEAEMLATCTHERWLVPLWGNAGLCERFLAESNVEAVFPVTASCAALGHDNHSYYASCSGYSLVGKRGAPMPRGAVRLL